MKRRDWTFAGGEREHGPDAVPVPILFASMYPDLSTHTIDSSRHSVRSVRIVVCEEFFLYSVPKC